MKQLGGRNLNLILIPMVCAIVIAMPGCRFIKRHRVHSYGAHSSLRPAKSVLQEVSLRPPQRIVFSNKLYRVGDSVDGYKIMAITLKGVVVGKNGRVKYIKVGESTDKQ